MNDRFKFRVWLEYSKLYYGLDSFYYDSLKDKYTFHFEDGHTKTIKEKDCVIEQCTGLKDKNGRLIFEGDIVRRYVGLGKHGSQKTEDIDVVKWYINGYVLENYCDYFTDTDDFEVIGNIHENPELMEV